VCLLIVVVVFDIHALQNQFYFSDQILIRLKSCIHLLIDTIRRLPNTDSISMYCFLPCSPVILKCRFYEARDVLLASCFPDEGAYKRFSSKFTGFPTIVCQKIRAGDDRTVTIKEGECKGSRPHVRNAASH
jgi:hypothetical protein